MSVRQGLSFLAVWAIGCGPSDDADALAIGKSRAALEACTDPSNNVSSDPSSHCAPNYTGMSADEIEVSILAPNFLSPGYCTLGPPVSCSPRTGNPWTPTDLRVASLAMFNAANVVGTGLSDVARYSLLHNGLFYFTPSVHFGAFGGAFLNWDQYLTAFQQYHDVAWEVAETNADPSSDGLLQEVFDQVVARSTMAIPPFTLDYLPFLVTAASVPSHMLSGAKKVATMLSVAGLTGDFSDPELATAMNATALAQNLKDPDQPIDPVTHNPRPLSFANAAAVWKYLKVSDDDIAQGRLLVEMDRLNVVESTDNSKTKATLPAAAMVSLAPETQPSFKQVYEAYESVYLNGQPYDVESRRELQNAIGENAIIAAALPTNSSLFPPDLQVFVGVFHAPPGTQLQVDQTEPVFADDLAALAANCKAAFPFTAIDAYDAKYRTYTACLAEKLHQTASREVPTGWYEPFICSVSNLVVPGDCNVFAHAIGTEVPAPSSFQWLDDAGNIDDSRSHAVTATFNAGRLALPKSAYQMFWVKVNQQHVAAFLVYRQDTLGPNGVPDIGQYQWEVIPTHGPFRTLSEERASPRQWSPTLSGQVNALGFQNDLVPPLDNDLTAPNAGPVEASLHSYLDAAEQAASEAEAAAFDAVQMQSTMFRSDFDTLQQNDIRLAAARQAAADNQIEAAKTKADLCGSASCDVVATWRPCFEISEIPDALTTPPGNAGPNCSPSPPDPSSKDWRGPMQSAIQCLAAKVNAMVGHIKVCLPNQYRTGGLTIPSPYQGKLGTATADLASTVARLARLSTDLNAILAPVPDRLDAQFHHLDQLDDFTIQFAIDGLKAIASSLVTVSNSSNGGFLGTGLGEGTVMGAIGASLQLAADGMQASLTLEHGQAAFEEALSELRAEVQGVMTSIRTVAADAKLLETDYNTKVAAVGEISNSASVAQAKASDLTTANWQFFVENSNTPHYGLNVVTSRAKVKLERAKSLAFLARRALEFRLGDDFSTDGTDYPMVGAPSSWASDLFSMSSAMDLRKSPDAPVGGQEIAAYVSRLHDMITAYSIQVPFANSVDTAVVSLRDDAFRVHGDCAVTRKSNNELPNSENLQASPWGGTVDKVNTPDFCDEGDAVFGMAPRTIVGAQFLPSVPKQTSAPVYVHASVWVHKTNRTDKLDGLVQISQSCSDGSCGFQSDMGITAFPDAVGPGEWDYIQVFSARGTLDGQLKFDPATGNAAGSVLITIQSATQQDGSPSTGQPYAQLISEPMMTLVDAQHRFDTTPVPYETADAEGNIIAPGISCNPGELLPQMHPSCRLARGPDTPSPGKAFRRRWGAICADGSDHTEALDGLCDSKGGLSEVYTDVSFDYDLLYQRVGGPFAAGGFNSRHGTFAVNFVGTGVRSCDATSTPSCYSEAFMPIDVQHSGDVYVLNADRRQVGFQMNPAAVVGLKGIASERVFTTPVASTDASLIEPYTSPAFNGRPLSGRYRFRIQVIPGFRWENVEDLQLLLGYRYWSLPFYQTPPDPMTR